MRTRHGPKMRFPVSSGETLSVGRFLDEELHSIRNISTLLKTGGEDAVEALNRNTKVVALN